MAPCDLHALALAFTSWVIVLLFLLVCSYRREMEEYKKKYHDLNDSYWRHLERHGHDMMLVDWLTMTDAVEKQHANRKNDYAIHY